MNVLAFISSGRRKGNTDRIVQMIGAHLDALAERRGVPLEFERVYLASMDVRPCRGCRVCFDRGEQHCPLKDDVPALKAKVDAADGIILASPVYVDDVNGIAKNWIDRLAYVCHRPQFFGKSAYLVATVASTPTSHTLRTMNTALRTWGCHIVGQVGYKMGALMEQEEMESRYAESTARVAERLFDAIARRRSERPSFSSLMMFKIQQFAWQLEDPNSPDYAYWKGQGWFDPRCTFYMAHRANPVKVALARLVGAVIARFVV